MPVLSDWDQVVGLFHTLHEQRNGFARPGDPVEAVTVRASVRGEPAMTFADLPAHVPAGEPLIDERQAWVDGSWWTIPVFDRQALGEGWQAVGPAVIAGPESTVFVPGGVTAAIGPWGMIELTW